MRGHLIGRLCGQQVIDIGGRVADELALLVDFELVETNICNFVRQVFIHLLQTRQSLLLFVEDFGQQQAAFEHADLLVQRLIALGHVVELLLGLQVLLGDFVQAVGAEQQVVRQF